MNAETFDISDADYIEILERLSALRNLAPQVEAQKLLADELAKDLGE